MEPFQTTEVRLSDVCRSCLLKTDNMLNFTPKTDQTSEVIAMLSSVGNIEIEINEYLPSYLCRTCEEKLRLSYDFQLLIQRSNEIIRECMNTAYVSGEERCPEEKCKVEEIEENKEVIVNPVVRTSKKLLEFSHSEVEEAINEYQRLYNHVDCIQCGFVTSNSRALSIHVSRLHKELKDRWCSLCNIEVDNLSHHSKIHVRDRFRCKFCGKQFNMGGHFFEHLRSHSSEKPHRCHICHKGFIVRRTLDKHIRAHMNNRVYKCHLCPRNFSVPKLLRMHLRKHYAHKVEEQTPLPPIKSYQPQNFCKVCKKRVRSLEYHLAKFHASNPLENKKSEGVLCTRCGKKFSSLSRFRLHMRTHTGETPYKCRFCDKRMRNRNHVVLHERTHTGEKPYVCNICGRGFSQTSVLRTHMLIHTGRPVSCNLCPKRFCRPAQLRLHMRDHTGEKPYQCTECDQAFKQMSHLSDHVKRHSDERPYKCSHCDKGFKQMSTLKSHITIHTGEKPFKCSQCPYACRQRYSLTQHMKQHSADTPNPEKPHFCNLCQKGYSTMAMLMSHNDLVHKV
ncbi:zinc finger protein 883-like isoform X2 [Zophobas morio]|uniref:zinc finger protein 883-like isoform X2 n=1 Tax=Zophobas morio TaxID=2755281 RepID=UPI003082DE03